MTRALSGDSSVYHTVQFRRCTAADFTDNNYMDPPPVSLEKILCPATEGLDDWYKLKNSYSNVDDRSSFSLEIVTCNDELTPGQCAEEHEIRTLVEHLLIT